MTPQESDLGEVASSILAFSNFLCTFYLGQGCRYLFVELGLGALCFFFGDVGMWGCGGFWMRISEDFSSEDLLGIL
jgi:hypothetical protein